MPAPMSLFPYKPRPFQDEIISRIYTSDRLLLSAPTGIGKSVSALCGFLADKEEDEKIIVLTRTKSQARIYQEEMAAISKHLQRPFLTLHITSKQEICPVFDGRETAYEEFLQLCRLNESCVYKKRFQEREGEIEGLAKEIASENLKNQKYLETSVLLKRLLEYGCPYMVLQKLLKFSDVVVLSYLYFLNPFFTGFFLNRTGKPLEKLLLIVDEAHNLQNLDLLGRRLGKRTVDLAAKEIGYDFSGVYPLFEGKDQELRAGSVDQGEAFFLIERGVEILEGTLTREKKVSHTFRVGSFLDTVVRLKNNENWVFFRKGGTLNIMPVFPSEIIEPLKNSKKLLFMSGTLEPVEGYQTLFGLADAETFSMPSIFPRENFFYLGIKRGLNTGIQSRRRLKESLWKSYAEAIQNIGEVTPSATMAFFPSYETMEEVSQYASALVEPRDNREMEQFLHRTRAAGKKLVFAVTGGKMSEGVEYTVGENDEKESIIKSVIAAGFPFPVPDFELKIKGTRYEERFGYGRAFVLLSVLPMVNKVLQSIGRAVRSERDVASIIFLDDRTKYLKYFPERIRHDIQILELEAIKDEVEWFHKSRSRK
ncbi:MAG: ATP-dependent DNA helicase [Candidatus Hydrothermarchaeaceae archaeon]